MQKVLKITLCIGMLCTFVGAKEEVVLEVDHLAVASLMTFDGKFDKANAELAEAKKHDKNLDLAKYYTIKSVIAMQKNEHTQAIETLKKAVEATKNKIYKAPEPAKQQREYLFTVASEPKKAPISTEPPFDGEKIRKEELIKLYTHLSQESYKAENYLDTVKYLDLQGEAGRDDASKYMLRADCYWKANHKEAAVDILSKGAKIFGNDQSLLKQKFYYFTELGLYQEAIESAKDYMKRSAPNAKEYMALAQMLITAGQRDEALALLEETKMIFPGDAQVALLLGHLYMKTGMAFTTASLFEEASYYDHKYVKEAAEIHRRVGLTPHTLYLNSQISDKVEKLKQKIAIYVDREEYENVIGLIDALERYKMLDDDNIRYAVAYAYYMAKDYVEAEKQLKLITDDELFSKATIIRKNIEKCQNDAMECI